MITQLQVRNWKSFGEATLYIDPLTILIGTNSSGKSNLLEAFTFLSLTAKGFSFGDLFSNETAKLSLRGTEDVLVNQKSESSNFALVAFMSTERKIDFRYEINCYITAKGTLALKYESLQRIVSTGSGEKYELVFKTNSFGEENVEIESVCEGTTEQTTFLDVTRNRSLLSRLSGSNLGRVVIEDILETIEQLTAVQIIDPLPQNMRGYGVVGNRLAPDGSNFAGVLAQVLDEGKNELQQLLTSYINLLSENDINKVWAEKVGRLERDAMLYIEESWPGGQTTLLDAKSASDGTLHFLAVMTAIVTADPKTLVIIEEVDKGLHPSRADLLVRFLKEMALKKKIDILCTTHNPALLDAFGNEMIQNMSIIYREDLTGLSSVKLVEDLKYLGKLLAKGRVGRLSTMGLLEKAVV